MSFHERLSAARKAKGLRGEDVGAKLGVVKGTISKWENGDHDPPIEQIRALCNVLKVSPNWLFEWERDALPADALEEAQVFTMLSPEDKRKWKILRKTMFPTVTP